MQSQCRFFRENDLSNTNFLHSGIGQSFCGIYDVSKGYYLLFFNTVSHKFASRKEAIHGWTMLIMRNDLNTSEFALLQNLDYSSLWKTGDFQIFVTKLDEVLNYFTVNRLLIFWNIHSKNKSIFYRFLPSSIRSLSTISWTSISCFPKYLVDSKEQIRYRELYNDINAHMLNKWSNCFSIFCLANISAKDRYQTFHTILLETFGEYFPMVEKIEAKTKKE